MKNVHYRCFIQVIFRIKSPFFNNICCYRAFNYVISQELQIKYIHGNKNSSLIGFLIHIYTKDGFFII